MLSFDRIECSERQIRWAAALLSLLFSLLVIVQDEVVNNDGALYLIVADLIGQGEWKAAFTLYPWPFLSILISLASQATGLMPEHAAYLLSMLFLTLLVIVFIDFIRLLGGDKRTQLLAALVILSLPYLNESRDEILRDHGYWLFYLIGLRFLFLHYRSPRLKWGLAWGAAILVSCLFRMEGFVMMAALPLILFLKRGLLPKWRLTAWLQANGIALLLLAVGAVLLPMAGENLGRLTEFSSRLVEFWGALTVGLEQKAEVIRQGVLPELSEKFAMQSVVLILVWIVCVKTLTVLTPVYSGILLLPRLYTHLAFPEGLRPFVAWVVFVNLVMLTLFVVPQFFLQARFTMPLVLACLLLVPFLLNAACDLWQQSAKGLYSRLFPVVLAVTALIGADGLISLGGYSKQYQRDAAAWMQTHAEAGSRVMTTASMRFCYYLNRNRPHDQRFRCHYVKKPPPGMANYFAIYGKRGSLPTVWMEYLQQAHFVEVQRFGNRRGDGIFIYQRSRK